MTFRQFAFNNVKRNARQYLSYFFSCMFSVAVFFIYAVIMFHPEIEGHEFRQSVQRGILAAEIIIFAFSFLFVMYSTGAFVKSRKKEYGLLMTLGISKGQLNRLLIIENTIIAIVSIVAGVLVGILFANLFIMGFSQILGLDGSLGFYIAPKAILLTVIGYFIMFEINSLFVVWTLRTNAVIDLFRGARAPKRVPRFSWILSIIGVGLVAAAYYIAWTAELYNIFYRMLPILTLIVPGTYLLYTQFSVAFMDILKKRKSLYFKQTNLLTISELSYKLKDHARLLFFVTILSAVAFTASGVLFGILKSAETEASAFIPQDMILLSKGEENISQMDAEVQKVTDHLDEENITYTEVTVDRTQAMFMEDGNEKWLDMISYSDYKTLAKLNGTEISKEPADDEIFIMLPNVVLPAATNFPETIDIGSESNQQQVSVQTTEAVLVTNRHTSYSGVVSDQLYEKFASEAQPNERYRTVVFSIDNWTEHAETIIESMTTVDREIISGRDASADIYLMMKNSLSHALFFGLFISVLFFLAAGSILYFKLYQDLDKDVAQYKALYRIGLTVKEMKKVATKQVAYLFFIPFSVAVIHASFAFKALQNMLESSIILPSITLISCYLLVYAIYFFFIRGLYISKMKQVM